MSKHEEKDERQKRACPMHDGTNHWQDDEAYVDIERLPVPEYAPRWDQMVAAIAGAKPENDDAAIYKFALVFVEGESGFVDVVSSPGMSKNMAINLLTRAASIMAFQEAEHERVIIETLGIRSGIAIPLPPGYKMPENLERDIEPGEIREVKADDETGFYL